VWYFFSITSMVACGTLWALNGNSYYSIAFGITIWCGSSCILHDGMHHSIGSIHGIDLNYWLPALFGWLHCIPLTWKLQHMKSHHAKTNQKEDIDIWHLFPVFFRVSKMTPFPTHGKVRFLIFIVFFPCLTTLTPSVLYTLLFVWPYGKVKTECHQETFHSSSQELVESFIQWVCLVTILIFGVSTHGFISTWLIYHTHGTIYFWMSQVSHANHESEFSDDDLKNLSWDALQRLSCHGDYGVHSKFWAFLSIGLNTQAIHHLFPKIHWIHYSKLYKILEEIEEKTVLKTYWISAGEFVSYIRKIN